MNKFVKHHRTIGSSILQQCKYNFSKESDKKLLEKEKEPEEGEVKVKKYDQKDITKEDMEWRTPWEKKERQNYTFLRTFYSEESNRNLLKTLQTPIDLRPSTIKKWWSRKVEEKDILLQSYIPERNQMLGNELAAAHFIVHRGGAVKFHGEDKWIKADKYNQYSLPRFYEEGKILQAIDCEDMTLHYEGLVNFRNLKNMEWLSLNGCQHMDDWCLDRISNIFSHSLIYLDLRDCPGISERGIGALYKMKKLKILYLDDLLKSTLYEMTCLLLEELNPNLEIRSDVVRFET